ncbi:UvrD-helicase domain-containing protein [Ruminococcus albus]|uniref:UvrD/REP helicase n=1 Tax=Ruminococcus albus (strain ATCC 27210 / DSM 20455 / JCM 14654 / NCDO 2250 / 7) TaxID=697329 RepID=E6UDT6_RUMA7|nr:UvrD-helicase domain-containing protein [Ruminococcus albus]ADU21723.1 UvrD/REP helicase [Ruminococcus albus 7 = DSM 20455]MBR6982478.1 ATP-dependent helicase [Ruminococcus sp.]
MEWIISDKDIESTEELLLPQETHFSDDARKVIRCWHSTDVAACPGSGKTTVLLAKLKLLADRIPFENGAGICVLSHTNVAVNEIKRKLSDYSDKILSYPNYVGTIQSFIDRFVTMPYIRNTFGQSVQVVDSMTYAQHMLNKMLNNRKYSKLNYLTENNYQTGRQFSDRISHTQALYLRDDGALCIERQKNALACAGKPSTEQYSELLVDLLKNEGIIRYQDAYSFAKAAIDDLSQSYTDIFSSRFQYVFIDEYQDCNDIQRQAINAIFDSTKCAIFKIGDSDQAIYNQSEDTTTDWIPQDDYLPIMTSCRFSQEIANVICKLKKKEKSIVTFTGETGVKPVLLVFSPENIDRVIVSFISELEAHNLNDRNGVYKAIGAIKSESTAGLKIGSYFPEFDSSNKKSEYNYWISVEELTQVLENGKLYKAEQIIRKLLCRIFHYIKKVNPASGKEFTTVALKRFLEEQYRDLYRSWIYEMSTLKCFDRQTVDWMLRRKLKELLRISDPTIADIFTILPDFFLDESSVASRADRPEKNVFIDPIRGRRIVFDTIHAVKGETHDATLYLETSRQRSTDLNRILPYFGAGSLGKSPLFDYSRKLAYVGMSRPKKLLCVAMQSETYEKSKDVFSNDWVIKDLR